jgi:short-subunit dehydrogenase involved in D-alanine esterification of teichoic acids
MNVSSVLGFLPTSVINPVYNGTKAFVHAWTTNMRTQLRDTNIKIVEIVPPKVVSVLQAILYILTLQESDLHRDRENPDDNKKEFSKETLTVEEFMTDIVKGWEANQDIVGAGRALDIIKTWTESFGNKYERMTK